MDKPKVVDKLDLGIDSRMLLEAGGFKTTEMLQQILLEIEGLLKLAPANIFEQTPEGPLHRSRFFLSWVGSAVAAVNQWDKVRGLLLLYPRRDILDDNPVIQKKAYDTILMLLYEAQQDLRLRTTGPLNIAIDKGRVFDYFDELKEIIKQATADLFFIDAYLDDDFISRYLPYAKSGVSIRLLTSGKDPRRLGRLLPAAKLFTTQNNQAVSVRTTADLHDRYVLVDHASCFSSGASFKDGAKNAGTTIVQLIDIFAPVRDAYQKLWTAGQVEL